MRPLILYVDDDSAHLELFTRTFEDYYEIHRASSAHQALAILRRRPIHLIISDQRMPGMTGVQLFEAIQDELPDPVRMILTSYADVDAIIRAINAGRIYRFIKKPWDEQELRVILDRALESHDLKLRNRRLLAELEERAAWEQDLRKTFKKYVPATVVDELLEARNEDLFLGELRVVAVACFGVHDFSRLSSPLAPSQTVAFLNQYHNEMNRTVVRYEVTVKDGTLAIFGAPLSSLDNAGNAVKSALEMVEVFARLRRTEVVEAFGEEIGFGVGVSLGEVVAGNIGSAEKIAYTVIGETVNDAVRMQKLTRDRPGSILLAETVADQVRGLVDVDPLEAVELGDGAEPGRLYRVAVTRPAAG